MKIVVHYVDGSSYTLNDSMFDNEGIFWDGDTSNDTISSCGNFGEPLVLNHEDVLFVEECCKELGSYRILFPPNNIEMSIRPDVMSVRQRIKKGRTLIL